MGLVTINDSDTRVNTVSDTPRASVSSGYVENPQPAPRSSLRKAVRAAVKERIDLLTEFKDVFEGLGELPGEYHIVTDESVTREVWQRTMHEFVEDLNGVEVIADDFLIVSWAIFSRQRD